MLVGRSRLQPSLPQHMVPQHMVMESAREWVGPRRLRAASRFPCAVSLLAAECLALAAALVCGAVLTGAFVGSAGRAAAVDAQGLHGPFAILVASAVAVILYLGSQAHFTRRVPLWTALRTVLFAGTVALLCDGFAGYVLQQDGPRALPIITWASYPLFSAAARSLARQMLAAFGLWSVRTVMVSNRSSATQIVNALASEPALGYEVAAVIDPGRLGAFAQGGRWSQLLHEYDAGLLMLSYDSATVCDRQMVESLVRDRVPFAVMPQLDGLPVLGFEQVRFFSHDTVMFTYRNNLAQPLSRLIKLVFDVAAATAALLVLAPVLVLLAVLVKLDGGPAFFGHRRIGAGGRQFRCLKFRSMVMDSDAVLKRLLESDPDAAAEWAETQKLTNDPRITPIGRILRATSLDELPQLFNVLRLEMSLVGPRPIVQQEVARYGEDIAYYHETRPGLTGLWQVSGRSGTSYAQRVQLDTWYVKNWTVWHDLAIIAKTVPAVLKRRGAC